MVQLNQELNEIMLQLHKAINQNLQVFRNLCKDDAEFVGRCRASIVGDSIIYYFDDVARFSVVLKAVDNRLLYSVTITNEMED